MRPVVPAFLTLTLTLSACQATLVAPDPGKGAGVRTAASQAPAASPSVKATATPKPGQPATPTPPASAAPASPAGLAPVEPPKLLKPSGEVAPLKGTVIVDARYALEKGNGTILADGGAPLVAVAGGTILSHNGGQLVAAGAGNLVAAGAGNVIVPAGAGLVAAGGLNGQNGSGLVAAGGLNGQNGGGLVAAGGLNYGLLQAGGAQPPALGAELPAAGMIVSIVDLRTGKPVSLGTDAKGQDVFEVYSNAQGAFDLWIPASLKGTVRVDARVPGASDPRLAYAVFVPEGGGEAAIDEDTALVTRFLSDSWRGRMTDLMMALVQQPPLTDEQVLKKLYGQSAPSQFVALQAILGPLLGDLRKELAAAGVKDEAAINKVAGRIAEAVLGHANLAAVATAPGPELAKLVPSGEPVLEVFKAEVELVRQRAAAQMNEAAAGKRLAAFLQAKAFASAGDRIVRPADVPAYIVAEALSDETAIQKLAAVPFFEAMGLEKNEAMRRFYRLSAANGAAGQHFAQLLFADPTVMADVVDAIHGR